MKPLEKRTFITFEEKKFMVESVQDAIRRWYSFGTKPVSDVPGLRIAISRIYYSVLSYCRWRLGLPLDDGIYAYNRVREKLRVVGSAHGFNDIAAFVIDDLLMLKNLRVKADYRFADTINIETYDYSIFYASRIFERLKAPRWDAAVRMSNPSEPSFDFIETFGKEFQKTMHRARVNMTRAVNRFREKIDDDTTAYEDLKAAYGEVVQAYFRIWYLSLDFAQSHATAEPSVEHSLDEIRDAAEVYFAARGAFFEKVGHYHDPMGERVQSDEQTVLF